MDASHKLPLIHPGYRYPPSRNPYWAKLKEVQGRVFSDNDTETHRGDWLKQFPTPKRSSRLHVEIGTSAGHVLLEWAEKNPKDAYIGIDWKFKLIFRCGEKAAKRDLGNTIFFRAHAERLHFMFGPGEIDRLYLYFPDPWPKKSDWRNRFVTAETLRIVAPLMAKDGVFHIKTDHAGYFEWMVEAIEEVNDLWQTSELTRDLHAGHPNPLSLQIPDVTLFEKLFIKDGIKINSVKLKLRS